MGLLVEEASEWCQSEFDERATKQLAKQGVDEDDTRKRMYDNMLPTYRRALVNVFVTVVLWFSAMRKDRICLSVKNTASALKLLDDCDNEEAWKTASKRKLLFDRILKEYRPSERSEPKDDGNDDMQMEKQQETAHKGNGDQLGGGSSDSDKLNVRLVSPSEQMALRAKNELLREDTKRGYDGFTPEDTAEIEIFI